MLGYTRILGTCWDIPGYWVLTGHPGYTMPVPWVYLAGACGYGAVVQLAMGLGIEPFTQQSLDLQLITDILGSHIYPSWPEYLNHGSVPYRRDSDLSSF